MSETKKINPKQNQNKNAHAIPLVIFEDGSFKIPDEAKKLLCQNIYNNIGIISLVGKYRTGKSFLLNRVILNRKQISGFEVGPTIKPCTKGIWIWSEPLIVKNIHCATPFPCFLIDTEGLGAYDEDINHDTKIFLIAVLISSLFIFNSVGAIDENNINTLSFILNLSKTIKINNKINEEDNENELSKYFPTLLWLLRDFSLKLEDKDGNVITEKDYLENALDEIPGTSEIIEEKNRVRNLIKNYFVERDCYVMIRPVELETDLQNLQNLSDNEMRKEFIEQSKIFRNKVLKKTKPKTFNKKILTGSMLIELIQSILNAINGGSIPVIENSWKYVMQNECNKYINDSVKKFIIEINSYRQNNKNNPDFFNNIKNYTKKITNNYLILFRDNKLIDDDSKNEFINIFESKLKIEINKFNKENEKICEEKLNENLKKLFNEFTSKFSNLNSENNIYFNNHNKFFEDLDSFKEKLNNSTPDFPNKNEILTDQILLLVRKFFDSEIAQINDTHEREIKMLKIDNDHYKQKTTELSQEMAKNNEKNNTHFNKLRNDVINEKMKQKNLEDKINSLLNSKIVDQENYEKEIEAIKTDYEIKINEISNSKKNIENILNKNNEQLLVSKMNSEKILSLNEEKTKFLNQEIISWKEKYNNLLSEMKNKESNYIKEISELKQEIKLLKNEKEQKGYIDTDKIRNNLTDIMEKFKENINRQNEENKHMFEKMIQEQNTNSTKELNKNYNDLILKNNELQMNIMNSNNTIKKLETQISNIIAYKEIVDHIKDFKCKKCGGIFSYDEFKTHYFQCKSFDKDNENSLCKSSKLGFNPNKLKIDIKGGKLNSDEFGKPYLEYIIQVNYFSQKWKITKTFEQFAHLYKTIKTIFKDNLLISNSSNIFSNLGGSLSGSFHENKIQQLNKFVNEIANIEEINTSVIFRKFFGFENFDDDYYNYVSKSVVSSKKNLELKIRRDKDFNDVDSFKKQITKSDKKLKNYESYNINNRYDEKDFSETDE